MINTNWEFLKQEYHFPERWKSFRRVINPDIGVITNIGDAHSENFSDNKKKAEEKLMLFKNASAIIYCSDYQIIHQLMIDDAEFKSKKLIDWSLVNENASVFVKKSSLSGGHTGSADQL